MKHDVHGRIAGGNYLPIQHDLIYLRICGFTKGADPAVTGHPTCKNIFLRLSPGAYAPGRKDLL
jgi:hypothetical protein